MKINRKIPDVKLDSIGRGIGSLFGAGDLGAKAGSTMAKIFGMGDYTVKANSLMTAGTNMMANQVPVFHKDGRRGIRITEREYLGDVFSGPLVNASSRFNLVNYKLNPTDAFTFPWLSKIARNFDQWEAMGIVFEFVSTSSEYNGTSQALGTVIMATEYDPSDAPFSTKVEMENTDYANSTKPSQTALHGIECDPSERPMEVMYCGEAPAGQDKFYDLGRFGIATQGCSTANANLGELWVSYDICFFKKQLPQAVGLENIDYGLTAPTALSISQPYFGINPTIIPGSSPSISYNTSVVADARLIFPPAQSNGRYVITLMFTTTTATTGLLSVIYPVARRFNCTMTPLRSAAAPVIGSTQCYRALIEILGPGATLGVAVTPDTINNVAVDVVQVQPDFSPAA